MEKRLKDLPIEIRPLIDELCKELKVIFADKLLGLYLHGSIAMGDFNLKSSDIDFMALLKSDVNEEEFNKLDLCHQDLCRKYKAWGSKLEGSYLLIDKLYERHPPSSKRPYINGGKLENVHHGPEWTFEKYTLAKEGIALLDDVLDRKAVMASLLDLKDAGKSLLKDWWQPLIERNQVFSDAYLVYGVLTMCRIKHTMDLGVVASKLESAHYVLKQDSNAYVGLILEALNWQEDQKFGQRSEALIFIKKIVSDYS